MLRSIDILIGLAAIMLALSMAVTVVTQFITSVFNSRGRHLKRGLTDLLSELGPAINPAIAEAVAGRLLTHPLVSGATSRLGSVIHREEFTTLLLELASGTGRHALQPELQIALRRLLQDNGIADPALTLKNVRAFALRLEVDDPTLATSVRQNVALLRQAESELVAKINHWFDQTMDRTSERFTFSTRGITFAAAALVAVVLQVDTIMIVNRLGADDKLREAFVQQATAAAPAGTMTTGGQAVAIDGQYLGFLRDHGLIMAPQVGRGWWDHWRLVNPAGLIITALLLSLGAPFWYRTLGQLVQLRSVLAAKDDAQRRSRQEDRKTPSAPAAPGPA
jgi:hypothetical protein